jgi:GT2 family glycosyltransferase
MDMKNQKSLNIFVAVPMNRPIEFRTFESFIRLANLRGIHNYSFGFTQNSLVYDARETLVDQFLKSECDAIMFIDSDMVFHPQSIEILSKHDVPFVTAKAYKRVEPYQPCFYNKVELLEDGNVYLESPVEYSKEIMEIQGAGMACALIKREVFERIEKPYFFPFPNVGEDLSFCLKLKNAGVKMYVDLLLQFGHLSQQVILEEHFQTIYQRDKKMQASKKIVESV